MKPHRHVNHAREWSRIHGWRCHLTALALSATLACAVTLAHAGTTWDGGGANTNVTTAGNWNDDNAPPFSGGTTTLFFSTGGTSATLDTSLDIARIILNATPTFSIGSSGGSTLTLQGDSIGGINTGITAAMPWLVGSGTSTLAAPITLNANQSWNVSNGSGTTTLLVSGPISGAGRSLTKLGNGVLALAAANTFTGTTTISGGTLEFRSGGNLVGPVAVGSGAALQFNNSFATSTAFAAAVSGSGNLVKIGGGAVRLTNASNAWTGSTTVSEGTLVVNDPAALGSGISAIVVTGPINDYRLNLTTAYGGQNMTALGGQLLLASGAGVTLSRDLALSGAGVRGLTGVHQKIGSGYVAATWGGGYALQSVGNNTVSGNIATSGTLTVISSQFGLLTLTGSVQSPAGSTLMVAGNGNMLAQGPITAARILPNSGGTLILTNTANAIAAIGFIPSSGPSANFGRVRVASGNVLQNTAFTASGGYQGGGPVVLEIRAAQPEVASFGTSGFTFNPGGELAQNSLFVDQAAGGTDINQSIPIKTPVITAANAIVPIASPFYAQGILGRNGYGVNISGTGGNDYTVGSLFVPTNGSNGSLTYSGNITTTAARGADSIVLGGSGDGTINGGLATTVAGNGIQKLNAGRWLITGTVAPGSRHTLNNALSAGTLEIRSFSTLATGTTQLSGAVLIYSGTGETYTGNILFNSANSQLFASQPSGSPLILTGTATVASGLAYNLGGSATQDNEVRTSLPAVGTNALNKRGLGTWVLSATNGYTGVTSILGGTLRIQAGAGDIVQNGSGITFNTDSLSNAAAGTLLYSGSNNAASSETVGALSPTAGAARIIASGSGTGSATLTFSGTGVRTAGATVDFAPTSTGTIAFTSGPAGTSGILGGWATFGGTDWVTSGATASRFTGYSPLDSSSNNAATNFSVESGSVTLSGAASVNSLKVVGTSGTTSVSLGGILTNTTGGVLFDNSAGSAQITGSQMGAAASEVIIHTGGTGAATNVLTVGSQIGSGASSLTKSGSGVLVLSAANAYTGNTTVNEGTLRLSNNAALGAPATNNRTTVRQAGVLDLGLDNMSGTAGILDGAGRITSSAASGTATLSIGAGNGTTGYFTGVIENGSSGGRLGLTKTGTGTQFLTGASTYTGPTTLSAGTLAVTSLANSGSDSGIGRGDNSSDAANAASLVFNGGVLQYTGANATVYQATQTPSVSIDRLFTLAGNGTIDSSGQYGNNTLAAGTRNDATLIFNKTNALAFSGAGARTLTLQGNSTGDNRINLQLIDNPNTGALSLTKAGTGLWVLGNTSNNYTGQTQVTGGALVVGADAAGSRTLPTTSNLNLAGGVLETSGTFSRGLGTGGNEVRLSAGSSGFSAGVADLRVHIGNGTSLQWGTSTFLPSTGRLDLNSSTSLGVVDFANPIDLNAASAATTRTISVQDNTNATTDYALISGVISGVGGITKTTSLGAGGASVALRLSGANTYNGDTVINNGALIVETIGSSTSTASNLGAGSGKVTIATTNNGELNYIGSGESSNRLIELGGSAGTNRISANGSGPLVLSNVSNVGGGAKTLRLGGNYAGNNEISSNLTNAGGTLTVQLDSGATWILSGSNSFTGGISWAGNGGALGIGSDNALGSGTSSLLGGYNQSSIGMIFAVGGSRTITNPWSGNRRYSSIMFGGTNSITLTGSYTVQGDALGPFGIQNAIGEGGVLTFSSPVNMATGTNNIWFTGGGQTVFNGVITNNAAGQTLIYSGTGTLTVQGDQSGATTFSTQNAGTGMILFSAANSIPGTGANVTGTFAGSTLAAGYSVDQAFLNRLASTSASFAVGLAADSSNNLDFSSAGRNLTAASLGAVGATTRIYSGTLTPNGTTYRLGGGGGTLDFQGPLTGASNTLEVGGDLQGLGGTVILSSATNSYGGATTVQRGILQVSSLNNAGSSSPVGTNGTINLSSGTSTGTLRYVGSGDTSNRTINIQGTVGGAVDASGSGALVLTGSVSASAGAKTLTLLGSSTAANTIGFIGDAGSDALSVVKDGPGVWRMAGANSTFSGGVTVRNGTLVVATNVDSYVFGTNPTPTVGGTAAGTSGTAALLAETGVTVRNINVASGMGTTQAVLIGGANATGTSTFRGGDDLVFNRNVSLVATGGGVVNFGMIWKSGTGTGVAPAAYDVAIGADGYGGTVRLSTSGTMATTGAVSVRNGTALLSAANTTLDGAGTLTIASGATLGGIGAVAAPLGGAGLVAPGNSPGILTAEAFDAAGGLDLAFEFEGSSPTYTIGSASVNDILRLTGTSPFLGGSLTTANVVSLYLPASAPTGGTFTGGFFTDLTSGAFSTFLSTISSGSFVAYYENTGGGFFYGGKEYSLLSQQVTVGTTTVAGTTNFQTGGAAVDGQVTTFTVVVPEPAALALAGLGAGLAAVAAWQRRRRWRAERPYGVPVLRTQRRR